MSADLKAKRARALGQFTRVEKRLRESILEDVPALTIERRYTELQQKWDDIQDLHDTFVEQLLSEDANAKIDEEEEWLEAVMKRFSASEIEADHKITKLREALSKTVVSETKLETDTILHTPSSKKGAHLETGNGQVNEVSSLTNVRLERIQLEKFDGDIRKYPKFKDNFEQYIKPLCRHDQLPFVLRSYLDEDVREDVDNLDDNLETLWNRLDKKYGNSGKLVDAILADLSKLPRGDGKNTLQMIKTVEKAYRDLTRMGRSNEMQNGTILSIIERKLPEEIRSEWIKIIAEREGDDDSEEKFELIFKLLQTWKIRLEYDSALIRKIPERKSVTNHAYATTPKERTKKAEKENCWIHSKENHPIWVCKVFKNMDLKERWKLVDENKACQACLETGCPGGSGPSKCRRKFVCKVKGCKQEHNSLLHPPDNL